MKRFAISLFSTLAVATALVAAQNQPPAAKAPSQVPGTDSSITGCLIQGSGPSVFILDNARMSATDKTEKGKTYLLAAGTPDVNFRAQVNHEVTVTGTAEAKVAPVPPAGQKVAEKDLPKLTAKSITQVADTCTMASR
jgi:hypothetical protein